jgi:hypothetical protein
MDTQLLSDAVPHPRKENPLQKMFATNGNTIRTYAKTTFFLSFLDLHEQTLDKEALPAPYIPSHVY